MGAPSLRYSATNFPSAGLPSSTATSQALTALIFAGSDAGIDIAGGTGPVRRFRQLIGTMAAVVEPAETPDA